MESELRERLKSGRPLRIKAGFDPTTPDLHFGHTVVLSKTRQFQKMSLQVIFHDSVALECDFELGVVKVDGERVDDGQAKDREGPSELKYVGLSAPNNW